MAESTKTAAKAPTKAADTPEQVTGRGDQGAPVEGERPSTATGADKAMRSTDGETRPADDEFGANPETFKSATWAQTHGENPEEAPRGDY
jgi:hypothetical protein